MSDILSEIRSQGFTHVLTYGGPVALDEWEPYGKHPNATAFYLEGDTLREREDPARPRPSGPVVSGVWRLLCTPATLLLGAFLTLGAWGCGPRVEVKRPGVPLRDCVMVAQYPDGSFSVDVYGADGAVTSALHLPADALMSDAFPKGAAQ